MKEVLKLVFYTGFILGALMMAVFGPIIMRFMERN